MAKTHPLTLAYARDYPGELALYLAGQGVDTVAHTLDELPDDTAAGVVARLPHAHALRVLAAQPDTRIIRWLDAADIDQALAILLHLDQNRRQHFLKSLPGRRKQRILTRLVVYPRGTVGALADTAAPGLDVAMPLDKAVSLLRDDVPAPGQSIWLIDETGLYLGLLDLNQALVARSVELSLHAFMIPVRALRAEISLVDARTAEAWLTHAELPVVDHLNHFLGTVSRARLETALTGVNVTNRNLAEEVADLSAQYFRVMGEFMGDFLGNGRPRR